MFNAKNNLKKIKLPGVLIFILCWHEYTSIVKIFNNYSVTQHFVRREGQKK